LDNSTIIEFVVFVGVSSSIVLRPIGRWMQRKGRNLERGTTMPRPDRNQRALLGARRPEAMKPASVVER
jgi:hypothetical protein